MLNNLITLQNAAGGGWEGILMIVALFAVFYFLMIRPQQKKQKEEKKFRDALTEGDKVITAGGIYGVIRRVKTATFIISIDKQVEIEVLKSSIYPMPQTPDEAAK